MTQMPGEKTRWGVGTTWEEVEAADEHGEGPRGPRAASTVGVPSRTRPLSQSTGVGLCHVWVRIWETRSRVTMAPGVPVRRLQGIPRENAQCGRRGRGGGGGADLAPGGRRRDPPGTCFPAGCLKERLLLV